MKSTARQDFYMLLMTVFGGSALLLAAIGIYGLVSYSVQQRTQEMSSAVRNTVVFEGIRLALGGVAIGMVAAFGLTRFIATLLYGVEAWDPIVFVSVPIFLSGVALCAVWLPARRSSRINPSTRYDMSKALMKVMRFRRRSNGQRADVVSFH